MTDEQIPPSNPGGGIVLASLFATALLGTVLGLGVWRPEEGGQAAAAVGLAEFAVGIVVFFVAFARAVSRSRTEVVTLGGVFFLDRSAPASTRRLLRLSLVLQAVGSVAAGAARPGTRVAFGILAPLLPLALMGLWGARHTVFARRDDDT